jgi:hypothetical protein
MLLLNQFHELQFNNISVYSKLYPADQTIHAHSVSYEEISFLGTTEHGRVTLVPLALSDSRNARVLITSARATFSQRTRQGRVLSEVGAPHRLCHAATGADEQGSQAAFHGKLASS